MKVILSGAAISLAAGLLLGAAMQPQLNIDDSHPAGPQMTIHGSGVRSGGPIETEAALASYASVLPDYVLGTNWKKSMYPPDVVIAAAEPREDVSSAPPQQDEAVVVARAADEGPRQTHDYPSMSGEHPSVIEIAQTPE